MLEIEFLSVSKAYRPDLFKKRVHAVTSLSFEVGRGEVFGLVGPNGAGKSTSIRLLLGLIRPDAGKILCCGRSLGASDLQRDIGYLSEAPYLYDHLTLDELLVFCGRASGLSPSVADKRRMELLDRLAMTGARKRPLRTFSKGMLQRAGICFALLHDPSLIVLDEPMSGLDPVGRKMVFDLLTDLKQSGKTIFFCSHILNDVERLCDRIGIMSRGRLLQIVDRESFVSKGGDMLHLEVQRLDELQRQTLGPLVAGLDDECSSTVISFPASDLARVADRLQGMGVKVLGSRNERLSLEDLFMRTVEADQ